MTAYRKTVWFVRGLREYTINGFLEARKKFESLDSDVYNNLSGKSFMVTGANSGIGKSVSLELAKRGATVHMVCRDKARGEAAQKETLDVSSNKEVHLHLLDMSVPQKVWDFASSFAASGRHLNGLVNNAGCMVNDRTVSEDGLEKNFATNTLGTYILTSVLITVLEKSGNPRIITVSSGVRFIFIILIIRSNSTVYKSGVAQEYLSGAQLSPTIPAHNTGYFIIYKKPQSVIACTYTE